jgi:hypothetical protein
MRRALPAALAFLLLSCAAPYRGVELDTASVEPRRLLDLLAGHNRQLEALTGKGSIAFDTPQLTGAASFELTARRPDSLLLRLDGPFGLTVGTFFLSRDRYVLYNAMENTVMSGMPTSDALSRVLPVPLRVSEVVDALCGAVRIVEEPSTLTEYRIDGDQFLLTFAGVEGESRRYWVDPGDLLVTRVERLDARGNAIVEMAMTRISRIDGIPVPRRITVRMPSDNRNLSIAFSSVTPNPPSLSFRYVLPGGARRVPIP